MFKNVFIENLKIGKNYEPLIIPEIGINHEGSLETAKLMVDSAHRAGAKIVKHQTHIVQDEMSKEAKKVIPGNSSVSIYEIMERCALNEEEEKELMQYTKSKGLVFLSTPFSRAAANRLEKFGVSAYKIGSGEMNNYPLVEHIANFGKPMIISTGMNNLKNIYKTVNILEKLNIKYTLMHTTNIYPTKPEQVRLGAMEELFKEFPNVPIGLSDHTQNNNAALAAIALGACLVERHFTDVKTRTGPDINCSMDEKELNQLLIASVEIYKMRGGNKIALAEEKVTIDFAFATVVSIKPIKKGETFTKDNIWVKRPGCGEILAEHYSSVIGKKASCNIEIDRHLEYEMIEETIK